MVCALASPSCRQIKHGDLKEDEIIVMYQFTLDKESRWQANLVRDCMKVIMIHDIGFSPPPNKIHILTFLAGCSGRKFEIFT